MTIRPRADTSNSRGQKNYNKSYRLAPFCDTRLDSADFIFNLLVHALRRGQVYGNTIEDVLDDACTYEDRRIRWKHEEWPLIPAEKRIKTLPFKTVPRPEKPATAKEISMAVTSAGRQVGIIEPICAHDLRRGVAKDTGRLGNNARVFASHAVAEQLDHTNSTWLRGTTAGYTGSSTELMANKRAKQPPDTEFRRIFATSPFVRAPITKHDHEEWRAQNPQSSSLSKWQIIDRIEATRIKDWQEAQKNAMVVAAKAAPGKCPCSCSVLCRVHHSGFTYHTC